MILESPDGSSVLARPNGLAGWGLPAVPVSVPFTGWDEPARTAAAELVGSPIEPIAEVVPGYWAVRATSRVPAHGRTWIVADEVERLGADAPAVRAWCAGRSG